MKMSRVRERLRSFHEKYGWLPLASAALLAAVVVTAISSFATNQSPTATNSVNGNLQKRPSAVSKPVVATTGSSKAANNAEQQRIAEEARRREAQRVTDAKNALWREMLPLIYDRSQAQFAEVFGTTAGLRDGMNNARQVLTASDYAEEVIGWESTAVRFQSESEHVNWMRARFHELILDPADLTEVFNSHLSRLHDSITGSNRRMLQELGLSGSGYQPEKISVPTASFSWLDQRIESLVRSTGDKHLQQAWGETAASQVAGHVALSLFNAGANSLFGTNQEEGDSVFSSPFGTAGNVASQMIVSEAVESAIATSAKDLASRIEQDMQAAMLTICGNGEEPASWEPLFFDLTHQHFTNAITAIVNEIGVDPDYAMKTLTEHWDQAAKQQPVAEKTATKGGDR